MLLKKKIENRNLLVDVLRGIAIIGVLLINFPGSWSYVYPFLRYSDTIGSSFVDVIHSFFLFTAGASILYSLAKYNLSWSHSLAVRMTKRIIVLFGLGVLLNFLGTLTTSTTPFRIMGDLQYIALFYGLATILIVLLKRLRFLIAIIFLLLITYRVLISISFPYPVVLKLIPGTIMVLIGYVTMYMIHKRNNRFLLSLTMVIVGVCGLFLADLWSKILPISRILISGSFIIKVISCSWIIYGCLVFLVDVIKWKKWTYIFKVCGMNALCIYVVASFLDLLFRHIIVWSVPGSRITMSLTQWVYEQFIILLGNNMAASLCYALLFMFLMIAMAFFLYRRQLFIKA